MTCSYGNISRMLEKCPNRFDQIYINGQPAINYTTINLSKWSWDDLTEWTAKNYTCGNMWNDYNYYYWIERNINTNYPINNISVEIYNCKKQPIGKWTK